VGSESGVICMLAINLQRPTLNVQRPMMESVEDVRQASGERAGRYIAKM
jgi:hypothetical protein